MKSISFVLLVSVLGFVFQAHAVTVSNCKEVYESNTQLCSDLKYYFPNATRTEYKVRFVPGGFNSDCIVFYSNNTIEVVPFEPITCAEEPPKTATKPAINKVATQCGSIVQTDNQVIGESVPVVGTKFSLSYFSNKVVGRVGDYKIRIPLTYGVYDPKYTQIFYSMKINGALVVSKTVAIAPNLNVDYVWNGATTGKVNIGSGKAEVLVQKLPGGEVSSFVLPIGSLQAKNLGFGGWVPSIYHFYEIGRKQVLRGDGSSFSAGYELLSGNLLRVADSERSLVYIFDGATGRHLQTKSFLLGANLYVFNYNSNGVLASISEPFNVVTYFNRNSLGELLSITAPNGKITAVTLDANKYISAVTSPANQIYSMTYNDVKGLLKTFKKPLGQVSTFTYDSLGNLTKDAHSGGYAFSLAKLLNGPETTISSVSQMSRATSYTMMTSMITVTDPATGQDREIEAYDRTQLNPDGTVEQSRFTDEKEEVVTDDLLYTTEYRLDSRFKNFSKTVSYKSVASGAAVYKGTGRRESFVLNDVNNPFSIKTYSLTETDQNSAKTVTTFDGTTRTFVTVSPRGSKVTTKVDAYERPISVQVGNDLAKVYTYTNDKVTRITQGNRVTDFTFNATTKLVSSTRNALGEVTSYTYDSAGRMASTIYPDTKQILYNYDANDKLIGITPAGKPKHNFSFNALELVTQYSPPLLANNVSATTTYAYNADKQLLSETRPDGKKRTYNYDAVRGTLKSITAPEGTYTYTFNTKFGEYERIKTPAAFETQKRRLSGGYLNYDVLLKGTTTLGYYRAIPNKLLQTQQDTVQGSANEPLVYVSYSYASDGKLQKAGAETITYDQLTGRVSSTAIGSGTASVKDYYQYNTYGELSSYVAKYNTTTIYSLNLGYDVLGRIIKKQEAIKGVSQTYEYAYDKRGRLIEVKKNGAIISKYNYDSNGNRTSGTVSGQAITASYDSQDRLLTYNSNSFQYNLNGELISKKNTTTNQITPFAFNSGGQLTAVKVGSTTYNYQIDGFGRRIQKSVSGTLQGSYIYMDDIRLAGTLGADGKVLQRYVYGTKSNVPDYFTLKGESYRIITDQLGSVRLVVRVATGTIMQEMVHDEFGRITKSTAQGYQPFGFAGGLYDHNTNLVQFGARWYDPEFGRWISKDPSRFNGGDANIYGYVGNNPGNLTDPTGNCPACVLGIGALVGASFNVIGSAIAGTLTYDNVAETIAIGGISGAAAVWTAGAVGAAATATSLASIEVGAQGVLGTLVATVLDVGLNVTFNSPPQGMTAQQVKAIADKKKGACKEPGQ